MPSTDLKAIMTSHQRILDICNDPDLDGDAKLFAVLVATILYERRAAGRKAPKDRGVLQEVCRRIDEPNYWIRNVIQKDIPRYKPPDPKAHTCLAPMIQREGPCGKRAITSGWDRDPLTGAATAYAFCTRHRNHADDWRIKQNIKEWIENDRPSPPPNAGGVLRRYFSANWDELYKWAAPYTTPLEGAKPPTLPRPKLSLITGGESA